MADIGDVADDQKMVRSDYWEKEKTKKFLMSLPGTFSEHVRRATRDYMAAYEGTAEETQLEQEIAETKFRLASMERRHKELHDARLRKENEEKSKEKHIEEAHTKLLAALKSNNWNPERIQRSTFKIYSDFSGQSVEELMKWVKDQVGRRDELE